MDENGPHESSSPRRIAKEVVGVFLYGKTIQMYGINIHYEHACGDFIVED
jgi:hypothetical protein